MLDRADEAAFETIYFAEDPTTALGDVDLVIKHARSLVTVRSHPWVLVTVEGTPLSVVDLTEASIVRNLGLSHEELTGEWRYTQEEIGVTPTQVLGRVCHDIKLFDGIRYPSSKNSSDGVCGAVFPDRLKARAFLEVYDQAGILTQRLP